MIRRLHISCVNNEPRIFPNLADKHQQRADAYRKLWGELHKFMSMYPFSASHKDLIEEMEHLWPEACESIVFTPTIFF